MSNLPEDRRIRPFEFNGTPFDPMTGQHLPFSNFANIEVKQLFVQSEGFAVLNCLDFSEQTYIVAKPVELRSYDKTDVVTFVDDDYEYVYTSENSRTASDPDGVLYDEHQWITPSYRMGEVILAIKIDTKIEIAIKEKDEDADDDDDPVVGSVLVQWLDLNTYGRCWAVELLSIPIP